MTSSNDDFRPDLKGRSQDSFSRSADKEGRYSRAAGDRQAVQDVRGVEDRANDIRERMREHNDRMKPIWTGREQLKIWEERTNPALKNDYVDRWGRKLPGDEESLDKDAIAREAHRRVEMRMHAKMERSHQAERNMIEDRLARVRDRSRERGRER